MKQTSTILLVDDEPKVLELLSFRLRLLGYRVQVATTGEEAVAAVEAEQPDLILLDVTMPGMDGLAVCSHLKRSVEYNTIPVLMLTARSEMEDVSKAVAAGADDYIVKPYDPEILQQKVQHLIRPSKTHVGEARS